MPTYTVTTLQGRLDAGQKAAIARQITHIHANVTGAPSFFAQVLFHELAPGNAFIGGAPLAADQIFVHGQIRAGRTAQQKAELIGTMLRAVAGAAATETFHVWLYIVELVPTQMAEFGHILPESGQEQAWMAALPEADRNRMNAIGR